MNASNGQELNDYLNTKSIHTNKGSVFNDGNNTIENNNNNSLNYASITSFSSVCTSYVEGILDLYEPTGGWSLDSSMINNISLIRQGNLITSKIEESIMKLIDLGSPEREHDLLIFPFRYRRIGIDSMYEISKELMNNAEISYPADSIRAHLWSHNGRREIERSELLFKQGDVGENDPETPSPNDIVTVYNKPGENKTVITDFYLWLVDLKIESYSDDYINIGFKEIDDFLGMSFADIQHYFPFMKIGDVKRLAKHIPNLSSDLIGTYKQRLAAGSIHVPVPPAPPKALPGKDKIEAMYLTPSLPAVTGAKASGPVTIDSLGGIPPIISPKSSKSGKIEGKKYLNHGPNQAPKKKEILPPALPPSIPVPSSTSLPLIVHKDSNNNNNGSTDLVIVNNNNENDVVTKKKMFVLVDSFSVTDLYDTGNYFDKQSPKLYVTIAGKKYNTERAQDAGISAHWSDSFNVEIDHDDYENGLTMTFEILSEKITGELTHVGIKSITLTDYILEYDHFFVFKIPLQYIPHKFNKGILNIRGKVSYNDMTIGPLLVLPALHLCKVCNGNIELVQHNSLEAMSIGLGLGKNHGGGGGDGSQLALENGDVASEIKDEPKLLKVTFNKLSCKDVYDTGSFFDKQDLAMIISIGSEVLKTERIPDSGTTAMFPESFDIFIDEAFLLDDFNEITLDIVNKNKLGISTHVGKNKVFVTKAIPRKFGEEKSYFECTLSMVFTSITKKVVEKGTASFSGVVIRKSVIDVNILNDGEPSIPVKLKLESIFCKDVFDTGSIFDKQDLALIIQVHDQEFQTERVCDCGTAASFKEEFELTIDDAWVVAGGEIEVEVVNKSAIGIMTHVGRGCVKINKEIETKCKVYSFVIELTYDKKKIKKGLVLMKGTLDDGSKTIEQIEPPKVEVKVKVPDYVLTLDKLSCKDVFDTGNMFDKQDLVCKVTAGKKTFKTERMQDCGTTANWPDVITIPLSKKFYESSRDITIEIISQSFIGTETHVGIAKFILLTTIQEDKIQAKNKLKLDLTYETKKQKKGIFTYRGCLREGSDPSIAKEQAIRDGTAPPEEVEEKKKVKLNFKALSCQDVYNAGSYFDEQDLCMKLIIGDQEFKTPRQQDCGTSAKFPEEFEFIIEESWLISSKKSKNSLTVELYNENVTGLLTHVGRGSIKLQQCFPKKKKFLPICIEMRNDNKKKDIGVSRLLGMMTKIEPIIKEGDTKSESGSVASSVGGLKSNKNKGKDKDTILGSVDQGIMHYYYYNILFIYIFCYLLINIYLYLLIIDKLWKLTLDKLACRDVFDNANGYLQDLIMKIRFGSQAKVLGEPDDIDQEIDTSIALEAGNEANFTNTLEIEIDHYKTRLFVEIYSTLDGVLTHCGRGSMKLPEAMPKQRKLNMFEIDLKNIPQNMAKGRAYFRGIMEVNYEKIEAQASLEAERLRLEAIAFEIANRPKYAGAWYSLIIDALKCSDVFDTGTYFDKQDLALIITCDEDVLKTERVPDTGTSAIFIESYTIKVKEDYYLQNGKLTVEVINKSVVGTVKHVAKGSIALNNILPKFSTFMNDVTLPCRYETKRINKGIVEFRAKINPCDEISEYARLQSEKKKNLGNMIMNTIKSKCISFNYKIYFIFY
jgi:hypothetical protein